MDEKFYYSRSHLDEKFYYSRSCVSLVRVTVPGYSSKYRNDMFLMLLVKNWTLDGSACVIVENQQLRYCLIKI